MFKLSPSSIGLMLECQRCFWLERHNKWKRPSGPFPQITNGMDRVLKEHFDSFMEKGKLPPEIANHSNCENMKLFNDEKLLEIWRDSRKRGIRWEDKEGNILSGGIDNVLVNGKKLVVLDYKTKGSAAKDDAHKYNQHQLDIYNFLFRKNGYETEDSAFLLFYFPSEVRENGDVVFSTELRKVKTSVKDAEALFKNAIKLLNGECPEASLNEKGKKCEWCDGR